MMDHSTKTRSRRGLPLEARLALIAVTAFGVLTGAVAAVAAIPSDNRLGFTVLREGSSMGSHTLTFTPRGDSLEVKVDIDLTVGLGFVTLYRYEHRSVETWSAGRLQSISASTDDDGERYKVEGRATPAGFVVTTTDGKGERSLTASADILPTSYWHPQTIERRELLDTQHGEIARFAVSASGAERVDLASGSVDACRYQLRGDLDIDAWYDGAGNWVKLAFSAKGTAIDYVFDGDGSTLAGRQTAPMRMAAIGFPTATAAEACR